MDECNGFLPQEQFSLTNACARIMSFFLVSSDMPWIKGEDRELTIRCCNELTCASERICGRFGELDPGEKEQIRDDIKWGIESHIITETLKPRNLFYAIKLTILIAVLVLFIGALITIIVLLVKRFGCPKWATEGEREDGPNNHNEEEQA